MNECKVCSGITNGKKYKIREMMFGTREVFEYFECSECGCLQLTAIPSDIEKYYDSEHYYSFTHRKKGIYFWLKRERTKYYLNHTGFLGKLIATKQPNSSFEAIGKLNPKTSTRILDVGCGDGELLFLLSSIGYVNLMGIDPFIASDIKYETGLEIKRSSIYDLDNSEKWDIIMLHHVFEHVNDPLETLIAIRELLNENGVAMIRIPTVSSYAWKHYKENWFQLDAPRHSFLHSRESMSILINKSGLKLKEYYYDSDEKQYWASEQYKNDIPLMSKESYARNKSAMFTGDQIKDFKIKSLKLNEENQGDQIVYLLEKA